ncbi:MAG: transglutaminase [Phycisphaerae bacterium]|nr:transglutaminase [Phycisphaerae bacterium]
MRVIKNNYACLFVATMLLLSSRVSFAAPGDVVGSIACPSAYPSGLAWDGSRLLLADWRTSKLWQIDPRDGSVTREWDAPTLKPHGLTFGQGLVWVSDDHTGLIQALDPERGVVERAFMAPAEQATGLAFAEETLFVLAGGKVYEVLPEDGTILRYFDAPEPSARCLAFDGHYLWVSDRIKNEIYMVEPREGKVIGIVAAPGPYPAGLTWADGFLWNVDLQKGSIYKLVIHDDEMFQVFDTRRARVEYTWALNNYGPGTVMDLRVNVGLPVDLPEQKLLGAVAFSREPANRVVDQWGQPCATFGWETVPAGSKASLDYHVDVEVSAIRYLIMPERTRTLDAIPDEIRTRYTANGSRYRIDSPFMQDKVREIVGDEKNPYWIARKIYDFVIGSLEYQMVGGWDVPEVVLKRGTGSCSEYTYTFIALCRAAGLPARYQGSIVVRGDDASIDEAFHRWAQVYLPGYGWVPVDANRGDKPSPADQARGFGELANRFLITTQGGGDSDFLAWSYNSFSKYKTQGYSKVEEDTVGFWRPLDEQGNAPSGETEQPGECSTVTTK